MGATRLYCMIALILAGASFLTLAMGYIGLPRHLAEWIGGLGLSPFALIVALMVFYIVLGCFLDGISMVVLTMGVILPTVEAAGIDLLWFGIFVVLVVEMAQITPPVGFNLFVLQGMTKKQITWIARQALPMFWLMIVAVLADLVLPGDRHLPAAADEDGVTTVAGGATHDDARRTYAAKLRTPFAVLGIRTAGGARHRHRVPADERARAGARRCRRRARGRASSSATSPIRVIRFTLPLAPRGTPFRRRVWDALAAIPVGESRTYGEIARKLHSAPRAVGGACGANPIALVVPCHRVVGSQGSLGGFMNADDGDPLAIKRWLLTHEGYRFGA